MKRMKPAHLIISEMIFRKDSLQTQETDNWGSGRQRRQTWWSMSHIVSLFDMWPLLLCYLTHGLFVKYSLTYITWKTRWSMHWAILCLNYSSFDQFSCVTSHMDYLSNILRHICPMSSIIMPLSTEHCSDYACVSTNMSEANLLFWAFWNIQAYMNSRVNV